VRSEPAVSLLYAAASFVSAGLIMIILFLLSCFLFLYSCVKILEISKIEKVRNENRDDMRILSLLETPSGLTADKVSPVSKNGLNFAVSFLEVTLRDFDSIEKDKIRNRLIFLLECLKNK